MSYKVLRYTSSRIPSGDRHKWRACHMWDAGKLVANRADKSLPSPQEQWSVETRKQQLKYYIQVCWNQVTNPGFLCPCHNDFMGVNNISQLSSFLMLEILIFSSGKKKKLQGPILIVLPFQQKYLCFLGVITWLTLMSFLKMGTNTLNKAQWKLN